MSEPWLRVRRAWNHYWFSQAPASPYAAFRIVHGLTLLVFLCAWWLHAPEWIGPAGYHLSSGLIPPLPAGVLPFFGIIQFGALTLLISGRYVRVSAAVSFLCLSYVTSADRLAAFSINSIYLFTLAVLVVYPGVSVPKKPLIAAPVRLLQLAMIAIYFSSGWHKAVFGDWLESPEMLRTALSGIYMTDLAAWALRSFPAWLWTGAQYLSLAFELFSPVLFLPAGNRWIGVSLGLVFHLAIALFMDQLIYFSLQMMSFYILFLPADHAIFRVFQKHSHQA